MIDQPNNEFEITQKELRLLIVERFNLEELKTLCFDLNIDYDILTGEGKDGKVRELIAYLKRVNRLSELLNDERLRDKIQALIAVNKPKAARLEQEPTVISFALLDTLIGHTEGVTSLAFSPDGLLLVSGSKDKTIRLWGVEKQKQVATLTGHLGNINSVIFSSNGQFLASASNDGTARLWRSLPVKLIYTLEHESSPPWVNQVSFSPDGNLLASISNNSVFLWKGSNGVKLRQFGPREYKGFLLLCSMAFSPDGATIVTGASDGTIAFWQTDTGQQIGQIKGHSELVSSVAFSPNGEFLVSGSADKTVQLWQVSDRKLLRVIAAHDHTITQVVFSPDGSLIASSALGKTVRLWRVNTGKHVLTIPAHKTGTNSIAFSRDKALLATGSSDGTINLWQLKYSE